MNAEYVCAISDVSEVNLDDAEYYLPLEEVHIGQSMMLYLEDNDDITSACLRAFRQTIQAWWVAAFKGAVKRLLLNNKLLTNLKWLQPGLQQYSNFDQVLAAPDCLSQVISVENTFTQCNYSSHFSTRCQFSNFVIMASKRPWSSVWDYFNKEENLLPVSFKDTKQKFTSNLLKHLYSCHPKEHADCRQED